MNNFEEENDEINEEENNIDSEEDLEEDIETTSEEGLEEDIETTSEEGLEEDIETTSEEGLEEDIETTSEEDIEGRIDEKDEGLTENLEGIGELEGSEISEELDESEEKRMARQLRDLHKNLIEGALYAAGKPLSIEILSTKLEIPKKVVRELVNELAFDYLDRSTALIIAQMGERYQMQIKPEYTEKISKFAEGGAIAEKYLRTLTIIALKQPVLKSMIIKLRGSGAYEHVKYLLENGLIDGKKKGRSQELTTTEKYSEMFGLPKDREEMKRVMIAQLGIGEE